MQPKTQDLITRIIGAGFFYGYVIFRIVTYLSVPERDIFTHLCFIVICITFTIMGTTYIIRQPAKSLAKGFWQRYYPLLPAVLPVAIASPWWFNRTLLKPHLLYFPHATWWNRIWTPAHVADSTVVILTIVAIIGNATALWSLIHLRKSFSIMAEARDLITTGPYRFVRHPIYFAQIIATIAICLMLPCTGTAILLIVFIITQSIRACIEEKKLLSVFPGYADYQKKTGMLFPKVWRSS